VYGNQKGTDYLKSLLSKDDPLLKATIASMTYRCETINGNATIY
jgi:hypothetical protein